MKYAVAFSFLLGIFAFIAPQTAYPRKAPTQPKMACAGVDLRSSLGADDWAQIKAAAASLPNATGRFWKIEKPGLAPSWLIGTMHVIDERVWQMSPTEKAAFDGAARVALELDEILEAPEEGLLSALQAYPERFTYSEDDVLKNTLPPPQFAMFEAALKERGLNYALLSRTKPWLIWATLSMPPCVTAQQEIGRYPFDIHLGRLAQAEDKQIIGLERVEEQLAAIDSLPIDFYVTSIIQLVHLYDRLDDYHETMTALYLDGEIGAITTMMQILMMRDLEAAGLGDVEAPSHADMLSFETILLDERNTIMAERAKPLLEQGNSFIAVGALHLVGESGLVEQFRRMGYQLEPIK